MSRIQACLQVGVLLSLATDPASAEGRLASPALILRTTDGSSLTCQIETETVPVVASYGRVTLSGCRIQDVRFEEDRSLARVSLLDGDRISGRIESEKVDVLTVIGRLSIPWKRVVGVKAARAGMLRQEVTDQPRPLKPVRFEITLRDGTWVQGTPVNKRATFHGAPGKVRLPLGHVRQIVFHDDLETCTVRMWNEDKLVGCIDWSTCAVSTGLGTVHLSTVDTLQVDLSLGGIDLVAKPYSKAAGNGAFKQCLDGTGPKRIQGRTVPRSEFIEAHASGRIEYLFDEPVREFRAILTMYESYSATKGNVIFRVETDRGEVFASRPIRNAQREDVYVRFPPARKLVLITDQNGSRDEDWAVWLRPEAR